MRGNGHVKTSTYINPVYPDYFADPFAWRSGDEYYAVGTGKNEADGKLRSVDLPDVFPLLRSPDLVAWRACGYALIRPAASLGDTFWAPEIAHEDGQWWLYYSVGHADRMHQLRVASSSDPLGPYVDCAALTDPEECPFAIDPHPFRDVDGRWYLFHARDFLDPLDAKGHPARVGTALVVSALSSMTELSRDAHTIARARCDWQRFAANRSIYGRVFDWHTLEGPCVMHREGRYYCFYSGGCWETDTYGVDYVIADRVLGPYCDSSVETGPRVLRTVPGKVLGPGHCSIVTGPDERTSYLVYHAWGSDMSARRMCIDPLTFSRDGPRSPGPTWSEQQLVRRA